MKYVAKQVGNYWYCFDERDWVLYITTRGENLFVPGFTNPAAFKSEKWCKWYIEDKLGEPKVKHRYHAHLVNVPGYDSCWVIRRDSNEFLCISRSHEHSWTNNPHNAYGFNTHQKCREYIEHCFQKENPMSLLEELKQTTKKAVADNAEREKLRLAKVEEENREQAKKDRAKADSEFDRIVTGCRNAALAGQSGYIAITKIPASQYDRPTTYGTNMDFSCLKGWLTCLHNRFKEIGIEPQYQYCHDGVGVESWYNMKISW